MKIELNALTIERLRESLGGQAGYLKLFFDTEGCGCNGVIVILIVSKPDITDIEVQTEPFSFLVDRQQADLFDESMRLVADENYPSYKLVSDSALFSNNIRTRDIR